MSRTIVLSFIIGLLSPASLKAQSYLDLRFGWAHSRLIDDGYSKDLLFRGTNSKLNLGYSRETPQYHFRFAIEGTTGKIKSKSENLPSSFHTLQPSVEYLMPVKHKLYIGGSLSSMNYLLINQPVFDNARLLSLHGLYFNVRKRLQLSETRHLQLTYRLPVVVYVNSLLWNGGASRLTHHDQERWLRALTTNGSFTYFDVLRNIEFTADYEKHLGERCDFIVGYKFRYFSERDDAGMNIYSNEFLIGLKIRL